MVVLNNRKKWGFDTTRKKKDVSNCQEIPTNPTNFKSYLTTLIRMSIGFYNKEIMLENNYLGKTTS